MQRPTVFVIMPFSDDFRIVYDELIQPALEGYTVLRADTRFDERGIVEKIVTGIRDADLVLADISNTNANVMYELAIAHTLGKPTVMISQSFDQLPFDIRAYPVHEYSTHFARASELTRLLREIAQRHRAGELEFANPVTDFIPAIRSAHEITSVASAYTADNFAEDMDGATTRFASFGKDFATANERFHTCTSKAHQAFDNPDVTSSSAIDTTANCIRDLGRDLFNLAGPLNEAWDLYARANNWLLAVKDNSPSIAEAHWLIFAEEARLIDATLNGIISNIAEIRAANDRLSRDVSGNLTHALETAHDAMTTVLNVIMIGKAHLARAATGFSALSGSD